MSRGKEETEELARQLHRICWQFAGRQGNSPFTVKRLRFS